MITWEHTAWFFDKSQEFPSLILSIAWHISMWVDFFTFRMSSSMESPPSASISMMSTLLSQTKSSADDIEDHKSPWGKSWKSDNLADNSDSDSSLRARGGLHWFALVGKPFVILLENPIQRVESEISGKAKEPWNQVQRRVVSVVWNRVCFLTIVSRKIVLISSRPSITRKFEKL